MQVSNQAGSLTPGSSSSAPRSIPFFNYSALFASQEKELLEIVTEVMRRGAYIMQKDVFEFEASLAKFLKVKHAFGVADGTEALIIALKCSGVQPGDEVIVPSHTFIASVNSIIFAGATPVLVDCGKDHMIDPDSVVANITKKTKCIMPVQLNGRTADMTALQAIADEHGLIIIEDAAQGLGSQFKGKFAGTFGKAGTFSFYPAKVLGCFGDGGGIVTNDDEVADKIFQMRDHGRNREGEIVSWGVNSRLDNLQAAVLNFKLKFYPQAMEYRRGLARRYRLNLQDLAEVLLPQGPDNDTDHFDVYQNYEIEAERRNELKSFLEVQGIRSIIQWGGKAVHQWPALGFKVNLPYTDQMFERCLLLPMNTTLSLDDIDYICLKIRKFYGKS